MNARSPGLLGAVLCLAACGQAVAASPAVAVPPSRAVLGIDQLADPGFTRYGALAAATPVEFAGGDTSLAASLRRDGFSAAATVRYTRQADFAVADGPLDVTASAAAFSTSTGASAAFHQVAGADDDAAGAVAVSTGPLGDEAHADSTVRALPNGLEAVQLAVVWRVANMLNVLVLRGRSGGTTLADALVLAEAQTANELGGGSAGS